MTGELPPALAAIRDDFHALPESERGQFLLELGESLPPLPPDLADHPELGEPVPECQSPIAFFITLTDHDGAARVAFHASVPASAPTTRGFAGILAEGLSGLTPQQVAAIPADYPMTLGLERVISPLRVRGMTALLARAKRRVEQVAGS